MGFDPEKQSFTSDNHELLPAQVIESVYALQPGDIRYVMTEAVLFQRTANHPVWINEYADTFTASQLMEMDQDDPSAFARVIKVAEGLIVDVSHFEKYSWNALEEKVHPDVWPSKEIETNVSLVPVIYMIWNKQELSVVTPAIETQYNINLGFYDIGAVFEAIEQSEVDEDDDEDEFEFAEEDSDDDGGSGSPN